MDRIDKFGPNGILPSQRQDRTAPVSRAAEVRRTAGDSPGSAVDVAASSLSAAGREAPIDRDRVSEIRKSIEQGHYPVHPAKIADAMIAAGYLSKI